ncbi:hypothetical protein B0O80DRAFT_501984 [Mortierella sp. GBAus27b]|nr:hypothetical protein B0O80DRAFT_501984 [Mortierella sp. GBAus27b]
MSHTFDDLVALIETRFDPYVMPHLSPLPPGIFTRKDDRSSLLTTLQEARDVDFMLRGVVSDQMLTKLRYH